MPSRKFSIPKKINKIKCILAVPNLYLIAHNNIYDKKNIIEYLKHIYSCGEHFGNYIVNNNLSSSELKDKIHIINIPRGGNTLTLGINNILKTNILSTNQGKNKSTTRDILDIDELDPTLTYIVSDTIVDTSNTMKEVLTKLYTYNENIKIIVVCVYCTPDGAFNLCNQFPQAKVYTFEIYHNMEWPPINKSINKRYLANLIDAGDCAIEHGYTI